MRFDKFTVTKLVFQSRSPMNAMATETMGEGTE